MALLLTGCGAPADGLIGDVPACSIGDDAVAASGVVLMAQAVPTASWVPCLQGLPVGWHFSGLDARRGSARFWLDSDRDGVHAIEVWLTGTCDTAGATEIPSDREGMHRLERVTQVTPQYLGRRYYLFDGGCLTVVFTLSGDARGEPLALATQNIGTLRRQELAEQVRAETGGRLGLDPPAAAGSPR
ncbi:hypothetical protein DQ238_13135 [Geodermatophilus sp. TF02-6]|nr:hypothetical protein DQ238_13135 [Geodermatophilus sp. TF02-6]